MTQMEKGDGGDDTTEKSPLKETEGETKDANGVKDGKGNQFVATLQDPKTRLVFGVGAAVILLLVVASTVVGVIVIGSQSNSGAVSFVSLPAFLCFPVCVSLSDCDVSVVVMRGISLRTYLS